jgi:tight adherence protein C
MSSTDGFLMVLYGLLGAAAAGYFGYSLAKMILPDAGLLAAQQRLGLESAVRQYRTKVLEILAPFYRLLVPRIQQIKMPLYRQTKKAEFVAAGVGDQFDPDEFVALKVVAAILSPVLVYLFALNLGKEMTAPVFGLAMLIGFFIPDFAIYDARKRRQKGILKELPNFMDLLTLSVEAGMDFMAAISRVIVFAKDGPLKDEFNQMMKELQLGTVRSDALRNLADRVQLTELSSFASILIQADQMGASIGPVLRSQSDLLRRQRFQKAEREGAAAAQKILIPMIVFIFPAVFIAIIGPMICDIFYNRSFNF